MHMGKLTPAMLTAKRLAGVPPEVNLGEHLSYTPLPSMNKVVHSGFETQRILQQGVLKVPQVGLMSSKLFKKIKTEKDFKK